MKRFLAPVISLATYLSIASYAYADSLCPPASTGSLNFNPLCSFNGQSSGALIGKIIAFIFVVAVIIALFFLIWGGIKWILSGGDKAAVEGARNHIIAAIVGLVIIFLSYFILNIVGKFFLGSGFDITNFTFPSFL